MTTFDPTSPPGPNDTYTSGTSATDPFGNITDPGAPPSFGSARSMTPIAVPKGYTATRQQTGFAGGVGWQYLAAIPARYMAGDQWRELPPNGSADLITLQRSLIQAGFLAAKGVILGNGDPATALAMEKLLAASNYAGTEWKDTLAARLASAAEGDQLVAPRSKAPLVIKLPNPDDVRAVVRSAAQKVLGGDLDPSELDQFVNNFQSASAAYQTQAYTAGGFNPETGQQDPLTAQGLDASGNPLPATPSTVTKPPAATQAGIEEQLRQAHPNQATVTQFGNAMNPILDTLRQSA